MTDDGDALFRALCEQPAEDTARLVYADWLEENGKAERAEFVRLQCEAWNLCPAYPTLAEARTRASVLLKRHGDAWHAELPALPGVRWGDLFVRGFVDKVELDHVPDIGGTLAGVFAAAPLRFLTVLRLKPGQLRELLACPLLARLLTLRLPGTFGDEQARLLNAARERFPHTTIY